jgi:putative transposase
MGLPRSPRFCDDPPSYPTSQAKHQESESMPGRARKLIITERQQAILQSMTRSGTCPQAVAQRAWMLLAFDGLANEDIAGHIGCERHAVGPWRHRWADAFERLVLVECCEKLSALPRAIEGLLNDLPRSGCPGKFTAEQVTQILAIACEEPQKERPTRDALDATGVG